MRKLTAAFVLLVLWETDAAGASSIEAPGTVLAIAVPASALVAAAFHKDGKGALQFAEAYVSTMALVYILKPTINRTRPNGGGESFPSGHSASAFAGAAFLQRRYGWEYGAPAYTAAAFVAFSRVQAKKHWTTDVLAGGAIGVATNFIFTRKFKKVAVTPILEPHTVGITLDARW